METIVVMVVTSLLIGLGGLVLINFSKYLSNTKRSYNETYEWKLFDTLLLKDWNEAVSVEIEGNDILLVTPQSKIVYVFKDEEVTRESGSNMQTFDVVIRDVRTIQTNNRVNWEGVLVLGNEQTVPLVRSKEITPAELINKDNYERY